MTESSAPGVYATSRDVAIAGVVCTVPSQVIGNDYFETQLSREEIADIVKMIGVNERRWVRKGETTGDLCLAAARTLLAELAWEPESIDLLIMVTQTPDYALPATACVLHAKLGLGPRCAAFDVNLGCSGFVYGLWFASQLVQGGAIHRAVVLVGDTCYYSDIRDRATALLFGDAGTAIGLEHAPSAPDWHFIVGTDGRGARNLMVPKSGTRQEIPTGDERMIGRDPSKLFMDGGEIFNFTLTAIPPLGRALFEYSGTNTGTYDAFLFHQANVFMIKHLTRKLKLPQERVPINMDRFGNTSSASIPLLMCDGLSERLCRQESRLAMFGFGVGYSWAAADLTCGPLRVARIVEL